MKNMFMLGFGALQDIFSQEVRLGKKYISIQAMSDKSWAKQYVVFSWLLANRASGTEIIWKCQRLPAKAVFKASSVPSLMQELCDGKTFVPII